LFRDVGLKVGTPSRKDFPARVRELAADDPVLMSRESLLSVIEVMTQEVERLIKRALDEVRIEPTCRRLMTVPGVGPLTALAFRATIDQPGRFRKAVGAAAARFDFDTGLAASFAVGSPRLFFRGAMRMRFHRFAEVDAFALQLGVDHLPQPRLVAILDVGIAKLTTAGT
jgi:hypothetical protein